MKQINETSIVTKWNYSEDESTNRQLLLKLFKNNPIPDNEVLLNLNLFMKRQDLSQIFFLNDIYKKITNVHGVIMEFGVRWGKNLTLFTCLRGIYEPYNHNRKIIGFDTFSGFPSIDEKDGKSEVIKKGAYNVTKGYEDYLEQVLSCHENENPISHMKKFILIKGDAVDQLRKYLDENPETIIAFAYFDFDIYEPTKKCLEMILPYMPKGAILGFDELNCRDYPGETIALNEIIGIRNCEIKHSIYSPTQSYIELK